MTKNSPHTTLILASFLGALVFLPLATARSALADNETVAARPQTQQDGSSTGPYDGADFEAAKRAFY
jgi:hypothetical protein